MGLWSFLWKYVLKSISYFMNVYRKRYSMVLSKDSLLLPYTIVLANKYRNTFAVAKSIKDNNKKIKWSVKQEIDKTFMENMKNVYILNTVLLSYAIYSHSLLDASGHLLFLTLIWLTKGVIDNSIRRLLLLPIEM